MNTLSQKFELKVTNDDVQKWIADRAPTYSKEDLILTLQTNNLTYKDWANLFREQLIQHRIALKLAPAPKASQSKTAKQASDKLTYFKIAVLTYESQLDADETYKRIKNSKEAFNKALGKRQGSKRYSWLTEDQIPFFSKIKRLKAGRNSKPIETDWGFLIVRLDKKEKRLPEHRDAANGQISPELKSLVEAFKKDPKLQINSDLLYSLKIKR